MPALKELVCLGEGTFEVLQCWVFPKTDHHAGNRLRLRVLGPFACICTYKERIRFRVESPVRTVATVTAKLESSTTSVAFFSFGQSRETILVFLDDSDFAGRVDGSSATLVSTQRPRDEWEPRFITELKLGLKGFWISRQELQHAAIGCLLKLEIRLVIGDELVVQSDRNCH
mmetsp:Transcript_88413/g.255125  ORF Transcript_88413/g.255125 Transcript_88413/m.255125 type:complete len:172 (+) Transcript_88413:585-1100(+)